MPIVFRSPLSSSVANATFLDKTIDDIKKGALKLYKVDENEADAIEDVQIAINANTNNIATTDSESIKNTANHFATYTEKVIPVESDVVVINDSEDSGAVKTVKLSNLIGGGGGGGGSIAWIDGDVAPVNGFTNGIETKDFDDSGIQEMFINVIVPDSYTPGDQITLSNSKIYTELESGDVLLQAETALFKNTEDIATNVNTHTSVNVEIASALTSLLDVGPIDLTDASGLINAVAVAVGDLLSVKIYRDVATETSSYTESAKFLKYSASVIFS